MSGTSPSVLVAVGVIMPVLGIVTVGLRFYTRKKMRCPISVNDWLLIPALVRFSISEACEARLTWRQLLTIGMGASLIAGEHIPPALPVFGSAKRFQGLLACSWVSHTHYW